MTGAPLALTYDGRPVAAEPPYGATVIVHRRGPKGLELLILRRAHIGPDAAREPSCAGDWTWTPPAGARLPSEPVGLCAQRELLDKTGLVLPLRLTEAGSDHWRVFTAEARPDARVVLSQEHITYAWVALEVALSRCRPQQAADQIRVALEPRLAPSDLATAAPPPPCRP
jgi:8-oxo-dGTP pyrophosphatase MutT (NUDIX family)